MSEYIVFQNYDEDLYTWPLFMKLPMPLSEFDMPEVLKGISCVVKKMGPSFFVPDQWEIKLLFKNQTDTEQAALRIHKRLNNIKKQCHHNCKCSN